MSLAESKSEPAPARRFKRVLLKISGEALMGDSQYGIDTATCERFAQEVLDARKAGFETYVIEDACRGIDTQGSLAKAWADMAKAGVKRIQSSDIAA